MTAPASTAIVIIPARMGSSRFPEKVLAADTGRPLIQHVCEAAARATLVSGVVVATDDERVRTAVTDFGGKAVMTRSDHANGTSRLAEAAATLGLEADQMIINVQGDEPEIEPGVVDACVEALRDSGHAIATCAATAVDADLENPNVVKVVVGADGCACTFLAHQFRTTGKAIM